MRSSLKTNLSKAVVHILKPIIRILMRNEVSHAEFSTLAKQAYVDVAYKHFTIPKKKMTYARVAVLTGLNRKEVVRLAKIQGNEVQLGTPNRATRVVNGWLNDSDFLDDNKDPLILTIKGVDNSFTELASRYSGDISIGAIIDELERIGVAQKINSQQIMLTKQGYIPENGELEKIDILSICTSDLLSSAIHNLEYGKDDGRFQRQLVYKNVPIDVADKFKQISSTKAQELLVELNKWLAEKTISPSKQASNNKTEVQPSPKKRIGLGIYYFENDSEKK